MAGNDVFLRSVPSDANPNDVRLYDPTTISGPVAYAVTLSAAAYALTGANLALVTSRKVALSAAAYAYIGSSLASVVSRKAALLPAAYTVTGASLAPLTARKVTLTASAYALTGASLTATYTPGAGQIAYAVTLTAATFAYTPSTLTVVATQTVDQARSKGGWDPYHYKRRNKRRTKREDVREFLSDVLEAVDAPEPVQAQADAAKVAATRYLAASETGDAQALLREALSEINAFYAAVRAEAQRRQADDEEDVEEILLLLS